MQPVRVLVVAVLMSLGVACSSSTGSGGTAVSAQQACERYTETLCGKIGSCANLFLKISYGDVATCKTRAMIDCLQVAAAPSTGAKPADITACATAAGAATCENLLNNKWPSECAPKVGALENGRACGDDSQCKSTFCGYDGDTKLCGVCAEKPVDGGACVDTKCPMGLACHQDKCVKAVGDGGACSDAIPCLEGYTCVGATCKKNVATEGAACDEDGVTAANCDGSAGLICLAKKCHLAKYVGDGQPCGVEGTLSPLNITGITVCEKNGYCNGADLAAMPPVLKGTCSPGAKDGETCVADASVWKGPGCMEPAECIAGKCKLPDSAACK